MDSRLVQERETDQYRDIDLDDRNLINKSDSARVLGGKRKEMMDPGNARIHHRPDQNGQKA
jgi:hypothetical protein